MKASFSTLTGLAVAALLGAAALSGCGGGGGTAAAPTTPTTTAQQPNSGSVPIGSLDLMHAASSVPVNVTSRTPAGPTVDVRDASTPSFSPSGGNAADISALTQHPFAGALRGGSAPSGAHRTPKDVAVNSPLDLSYQGGVVLGSAVSHNLFLNCNVSCRNAQNFNPGQFLADLGSDPFITLLYQYLTTPGVLDTAPLTGSYTKGNGLLVNDTYQSPRPGSSNPYYGQLQIILAVLNASQQPSMGGGGLGHVYHVFLPKNVDTCFESPLGSPTSTCYSPDNSSTFVFCAYHGSFTATVNGVRQRFLYSAEPYQDVGGCRNNVHNQALPNAVSPGVDPADAAYSTLSHELFETISDPLGNAWWSEFTGAEMGDLCSAFDNFVTVNGHQYVLQSEYSDLHHICISGNLTSPAQTPQQQPY